jgi:hypothetical protein
MRGRRVWPARRRWRRLPSVPASRERVTPLHKAAAAGQPEEAMLLVRHGSDSGARDRPPPSAPAPDARPPSTAGEEGRVAEWSVAKQALLALSPDDSTLLAGTRDIKIWHLASRALLKILTGHAGPVCCLQLAAGRAGQHYNQVGTNQIFFHILTNLILNQSYLSPIIPRHPLR